MSKKNINQFTKLIIAIAYVLISVLKVDCNASSINGLKPSSGFYVNDYANVINLSTEEEMNTQLNKLANDTGVQIVFLTIDDLENNNLEEYANKIFRQWGIGDKQKSLGILVLFSENDKKVRIEVGYGLEECFTDSFCSMTIQNTIDQYFRYYNYNEGLKNIYDELLLRLYNKGYCKENYLLNNNIIFNEDGTYVKEFISNDFVTSIKYDKDGKVISKTRQNMSAYHLSKNYPDVYGGIIWGSVIFSILIAGILIYLAITKIKKSGSRVSNSRIDRDFTSSSSSFSSSFSSSSLGFGGSSGGGGASGSW